MRVMRHGRDRGSDRYGRRWKTTATFLVLGEVLHFGRAATRLHMHQPAPSRPICDRKKRLSVLLFSRDSRTVTSPRRAVS
ncbi:LysR family transcriptional regulator [Streptomyces sp. NPDC051207]|uniref:LysR family transcriptional regulator n=1 Tax=Streptomyces sp. NPDC051207 TaxID=3154641 RepID=UPI00341C3428